MKTSILISAIASFFGVVTAANATAILTLDPTSGALLEQAPNYVGWGFTLSNPSDYAVVSSSNFCLGTSGVTSLCMAPTIGTYTDQIAANYTIVGPSPESPVITQAFYPNRTGVGNFTINRGVPVGATNVGQLVLTYDLYSVDPNSTTFDPTQDLVSAGNFLTAAASVSIISNTVTTSPEPASGWLITLVAGAFVLWTWKRKLAG